MIIALYRMVVGEDFIVASIKSILDHVDHVFVFWDRPDPTLLLGSNEDIHPPANPDGAVDKARSLAGSYSVRKSGSKIHVARLDLQTPLESIIKDQVCPLLGEEPEIICLMEPWHMFADHHFKLCLAEFRANGVERGRPFCHRLWRSPHVSEIYSFPRSQSHYGPVFRSMKGSGKVTPNLDATSYDLEFCLGPRSQYWRHQLDMAVNEKRQERWYSHWEIWQPNTNASSVVPDEPKMKSPPEPIVGSLPELIEATVWSATT